MDIKLILEFDAATVDRILEIWESSVRATHDFLFENDIEKLKPIVRAALPQLEKLFGLYDDKGSVCAFMGMNGSKIEMLFIDSALRKKGIGRKLIQYAFDNTVVEVVDVNEQNPQAVGFYEHMGFKTFERSELDGQGNPFPILRMRRESNK